MNLSFLPYNTPLRVAAFLDLIARSEGTSTSPWTKNDGFDVIVEGINSPHIFTDYSRHPGILVTVRENPLLKSTAAGRYQLLFRYWKDYCKILGLSDFEPLSQNLIAMRQISERGAVDLIESGEIESAVQRCSNIWASFPGNNYGQNPHQMETVLGWYNDCLSAYSK